jgi:hypothetical protein
LSNIEIELEQLQNNLLVLNLQKNKIQTIPQSSKSVTPNKPHGKSNLYFVSSQSQFNSNLPSTKRKLNSSNSKIINNVESSALPCRDIAAHLCRDITAHNQNLNNFFSSRADHSSKFNLNSSKRYKENPTQIFRNHQKENER